MTNEENVIPIYCLISRKLRSYVEENFKSDKITADPISVKLFFSYYRRILNYFKDSDLYPFVSLDISIVEKGPDNYEIEVYLVNTENKKIKIEDENFAKSCAHMYGKELTACFHKSVPLRIMEKFLEEFEKNERKEK